MDDFKEKLSNSHSRALKQFWNQALNRPLFSKTSPCQKILIFVLKRCQISIKITLVKKFKLKSQLIAAYQMETKNLESLRPCM